jgi:TolB protein
MRLALSGTRRRSATTGAILATVLAAATVTTGSAGAAHAVTTTPIVFSHYTDNGVLEDIYGVPASGGAPTQMTGTPGISERGPSWAPNGLRMVLLRYGTDSGGSTVNGLWVADASGNAMNVIPGTGTGFDPAWSPDGTRIAFAMPYRGQQEIYVVTPAGAGLTRLTYNAADDSAPSWSPDGASLVFSRRDAAGFSSLVEIGVASLAETALTAPGVSVDNGPDWSRGNDIVFSRAASTAGIAHLFVVHSDGTGLHQITASRLNDRNPSWAPDARRLVFSRGGSDDQDPEQLCTAYSDGTGQTQLTSGTVHDIDADWGPF